MNRVIYLNPNEEKALRMLAEGKNNYALREHCEIPLSGVAIFTQEIRRQTGISDTRYPKECRDYLERYAKAMENPVLSAEEKELIRRFTRHEHLEGIAYQMKMEMQEAQALLNRTLHKMGIFSHDERCQRVQARIFLTTFYPPSEPQTEIHWRILRDMADGFAVAEIASRLKEPLKYVQFKLKEICLRLELVARGRDVQRNLIRVYMDAHPFPSWMQKPSAAAPANPMDDPMF